MFAYRRRIIKWEKERDSSDGNFVQHFATAQNFIFAVYNSLKFASLYPTMWGNGNLGFLNAVRGIGTCLHTVPSSILGTRLFAGERWFLLLENCFLRFVDSDAKQTTGVVCTLHPLLFLPFFLSFCIFIWRIEVVGKNQGSPDRWRGWRVFDAERMEGKHWREKRKGKKRKKKCGRSLTSAWECAWSWGRAIGRGCTLERIMKGKRELMGPRWPVPRSPFFILLSTACILLACLPVSYTFLASIIIDYF